MARCARSVLVALVALTVALVGTSTAAANFLAVATDPAGDATDPQPARDLTGLGFSYDRDRGELLGAVRFAGEPSEETRAFVSLFAGTQVGSGCNGVPAAGFGSYTDEFGASWLRIDTAAGDGPRGEADKVGFMSRTQEFEIVDPQLEGHRLDCVIAIVSEPGNANNVYDTAGPVPLVGQPTLSLTVRGTGQTFRAGRPRQVKLTLANGGDGATRPVRLAVNRARGMKVTLPKRSLKAIAPGRRATVTATVTLSRRARAVTDLKVTATAGDLVARHASRLTLRTPTTSGGGGGDDDFTPQVCNRWVPDLSGATGGQLILVAC